ncbi:pyrophosphatase (mapped), isoform CRA_a [Rattus norvegicus]|uniref:Pyrophosphatase (Mapped), isoform CRA_a n=1 Tax=Rattus norvegicus TaxID=10116 RepID=A6K404_RAT|nr:pyrophosphatase (mapped), isoform CRA_a [Rattus norvegicus]
MQPKPLWMLYHHHVSLPAHYQWTWINGSIIRKTDAIPWECRLIRLYPVHLEALDTEV